MFTIELRADLAERIKSEAERRQVDIEELVNEWLELQLWQEWHRNIYEEQKRYQEKHAELYSLYAGKYIAMKDGIVIDNDQELSSLNRRIREKFGSKPVLITPVLPQPIQHFHVISPRRSRLRE